MVASCCSSKWQGKWNSKGNGGYGSVIPGMSRALSWSWWQELNPWMTIQSIALCALGRESLNPGAVFQAWMAPELHTKVELAGFFSDLSLPFPLSPTSLREKSEYQLSTVPWNRNPTSLEGFNLPSFPDTDFWQGRTHFEKIAPYKGMWSCHKMRLSFH